MNLFVIAAALLATQLAEHGEGVGSTPIGTPIAVPILIIIIVLLLFLWGLTRNQIVEAPAAHGHDDAHGHDEHGHDGPGEGHDHSADHAAVAEPEAEPETAVADTRAPDPVSAVPPKPDDLKIIEGIGPKISSILAEAGITTFAQLAAASVPALNKIVREDAGITIAFPDTWPEQAALAAAGKWDELETLQDNLKGGRKA